MDVVGEVFDPIPNRRAWLVRRGYGSFVTLEFGEPELEFTDPFLDRLYIDGAPERAMRRRVSLHGRWHLWIYCCWWTLTLDGVELACCESDDSRTARALTALDGQALSSMTVSPADGSSRFTFDLGCVLTTEPAPPGIYGSGPVEQWKLFQPTGDVLIVRSDGTYWQGPGSTKPEHHVWAPLQTD